MTRAGLDDRGSALRDAIAAAETAMARELKIERRRYDAWLAEKDTGFAERLRGDHDAACVRELHAEIAELKARLIAADGESAGR